MEHLSPNSGGAVDSPHVSPLISSPAAQRRTRTRSNRSNRAAEQLGKIEGLPTGSAAEIEHPRELGKPGTHRERSLGARAIAGSLARQTFVEFEEDVPPAFFVSGHESIDICAGINSP